MILLRRAGEAAGVGAVFQEVLLWLSQLGEMPGKKGSVVLNHNREAEKLEYEQQRELWDWKPTRVFGFVWEQALGEREEGAPRPV